MALAAMTTEQLIDDRLKEIESKVDFIYAFCVQFNEFMAANTPVIMEAVAQAKPMIEKVRPMFEAMGLG